MLPFAGLGIANAVKGFFSGANKEARQQRKEEKKQAKETAKKLKEDLKKNITGGAGVGAKAGELWTKVVAHLKENWVYYVIGIAVIGIIWFMFFRKKRGTTSRRRTGSIFNRSGKGSASMKARMARVRAARKRKRK